MFRINNSGNSKEYVLIKNRVDIYICKYLHRGGIITKILFLFYAERWKSINISYFASENDSFPYCFS